MVKNTTKTASNYKKILTPSQKQELITQRKAATEEKNKQQENWRKIVVKVISWSSGLTSGGIITKQDKITLEEWELYCNRSIQINVNKDQKLISKDLESTRIKIEQFGGFEQN